jgi:hypothetical protein
MREAYDDAATEEIPAPGRLSVNGEEGRMTFRRRHHVQLVNRLRHWLAGLHGNNAGIAFA